MPPTTPTTGRRWPEYYALSNRDVLSAGTSQRSRAWYAQIARNLGDRFTLYGRTEGSSLSRQDPYFTLQASGSSYRRLTAGLRYNVTPKAALKLEWMRGTEDGVAGTPSSLALQYAVRF